jgi:hypothetical protein
LGISVTGFVWLSVRESAARRLIILLLAVFIAYGVSYTLAPYLFLPSRHLRYSIPVIATIMFPAAISALAGMVERFLKLKGLKPIGVLLLTVLVLAFLGGRGSEAAGLNVCLENNQRIYRAVQSFPPNSVVAGWPRGLLNNIPYLCKRRAFMTFETHITFHKGYIEEMRRRMRALLEAYFASSLEPLVRLREEFGVTHLLVNTQHYSINRPSYFKPFDEWVKTAYTNGKRAGFELPRHFAEAGAEAGIFSDGPYVLVDLSRLRKGDET